MVTGGEGYLSGGTELSDIAVEPFEEGGRVALAGEDGVVRVWKVGSEGVLGAGPEPDIILKGEPSRSDYMRRWPANLVTGKGIDKIAQLAFHPTAKDLLIAATNDHGKAFIRFWALSTAEEVKVVELDMTGIFNMTWAPNGDRVAVATKDGRISVLDPRDPSAAVSGKAHDSPRSFQMAWIDETHLISVGFSRGSLRKINLYQLPSSSTGEIKTIHSLTIDVSPSVLFPQYDADTSILYIWGKGERQIQAYEVHPENDLEPIAKLPSYTAGDAQLGVAWFSKKMLDVTKVEMMRALRLTGKTIEELSFTIPRNKVRSTIRILEDDDADAHFSA